jgi:hypothetical protein
LVSRQTKTANLDTPTVDSDLSLLSTNMAYGSFSRKGGRFNGGYKSRGGGLFKKARYSRPGVTRVAGYDQQKVYFDPFSTATTNPKIPDGKCTLSAGQRFQTVSEYVTNSSEGTLEFTLFAGIQTGLTVFKSNLDIDPDATMTAEFKPYNNHAALTAYPGLLPTDPVKIATDFGEKIAKWRCVSQALRLTLTNNSDENDGWFEAIRYTHTDDPLFYEPIGLPATFQSGNKYPITVAVQEREFNNDDGQTNMVEHPSYISGKLRDLHTYVFQLRAQNTDHPFREINKQYFYPTNDKELNDDFIDKSFDIIRIRIHGRPGSATPTRILAHVVCNQEIMYEAGSSMARFHSECSMIPNFSQIAGAAQARPGAVVAAHKKKKSFES